MITLISDELTIDNTLVFFYDTHIIDNEEELSDHLESFNQIILEILEKNSVINDAVIND